LTGDQRHRNDITNGQHLNRHADRPYIFYFFPIAHFLKTILASPQVAHLALSHPQADPSQSQKSHFLPTHLIKMYFCNNYILKIKE
jgi:hypothetical protein